jgi:hypothetical protein
MLRANGRATHVANFSADTTTLFPATSVPAAMDGHENQTYVLMFLQVGLAHAINDQLAQITIHPRGCPASQA